MDNDILQKELIIGIVEHNGSILMRKKPEGSLPYKETWYLFGCDRIPDRNDPDTLQDYLKKEIGIDVKIRSELMPPSFEFKQDKDRIKKKFFYVNLKCVYISGESKVPAGAEKVEWVPISKLGSYDVVPPSVELLKQLRYMQ